MNLNIPRPWIEPEATPPPPTSVFKKRPAEEIELGDLVLVGVKAYRVVRKRRFKGYAWMRFTLYPLEGGIIISEDWFPRQWQPCVKKAALGG